MNVSARADYALRALLVLASQPPPGLVKGEALAASQDLPLKFLERILGELRRAGIVTARRGGTGGYRLARPAAVLSVAEVIRVVDGRLVTVRGAPPEDLRYHGAAERLAHVWCVTAARLTALLEEVTLGDLVAGVGPPLEALGGALHGAAAGGCSHVPASLGAQAAAPAP